MAFNDFEDSDEIQDIDPEELPGLVGYVKNKFSEAETGRRSDEQRWLKAYKNYRGVYDSSTKFRDSERSKVFIKITKTKVLAAYGQIVDILFANNRFPISVQPTPMPEGISDIVHLESPQEQQASQPEGPEASPYGFAGDGREFPPGALGAGPQLGGLENELSEANLAEGPGKMGQPQINPAEETARNMQKVIHDQLEETTAVNVLRHALFECSLLGTGIVKGPFNYEKQVHKWELNENGDKFYVPYNRAVPKIEAVSCWDFYPDPSATYIEDCEYVIQRHKMNREQLRDLVNRPFFISDAIEEVLKGGPNYEERYFENIIQSEDTDISFNENRYEVLEYWGVLDKQFAERIDLDVPDKASHLDSVRINAWICGGQILRIVLNPFTPSRIPYQAVPYEINPYQFFGVGVAENMEDAQLLMNGHVRMAIDNLALAGNLVFDVDEAQLVPGQSMDIYPGKIFRRQSGAAGQAVVGIKFPNTAGENIQMYDKARQLADEETGLPSIMHGQTGVTGTGRTAAGLSMLLSSASISVKTVVKNIDDYLLKPLGEAFFQWNMQFNDTDPEIIGDLEIKPRGTSAVMQKEVRSQRLITLLQTVSNPMLAPFIKIPNLIRELAISQDIDPDKLVNNQDEAAIFADILKGLAGNAMGQGNEAGGAGQQPPGMGGAGGVPPGANPMDPSGAGGGNVGVGNAPTPGESNFTGNPPGT